MSHRRERLVAAAIVGLLVGGMYLHAKAVPTWWLHLQTGWLDQQLGWQMRSTPGPGYATNIYGSFDAIATRDQEIAVLRRLVALEPEEPAHRYLLAGCLARALQFAEAEVIYDELAKSSPNYRRPALLGQAQLYWVRGDETKAQTLLDQSNKLAKESGLPIVPGKAEVVFGQLPERPELQP